MRIFSGHCEVMKMAKLTDCRGTTNMPLHCKETNTMMFIDKKKTTRTPGHFIIRYLILLSHVLSKSLIFSI